MNSLIFSTEYFCIKKIPYDLQNFVLAGIEKELLNTTINIYWLQNKVSVHVLHSNSFVRHSNKTKASFCTKYNNTLKRSIVCLYANALFFRAYIYQCRLLQHVPTKTGISFPTSRLRGILLPSHLWSELFNPIFQTIHNSVTRILTWTCKYDVCILLVTNC